VYDHIIEWPALGCTLQLNALNVGSRQPAGL
jgi:hypothetical protein